MLFIKNELIPKMEADYGADTSRESRIILGHSFGGLLAAYAFTNFNEVFGNYLMLSPSLWYDDESLLRKERATREANSHRPQLVYIGLGGLETSTNMGPPFEAFSKQLKDNYPGIKNRTTFSSRRGSYGFKKSQHGQPDARLLPDPDRPQGVDRRRRGRRAGARPGRRRGAQPGRPRRGQRRGAKDVSLTSRPSREAANRLYLRLGFVARETNVYRYTF